MRCARLIECRGQPDSWYLSFASPKERYQRKGDPVPPPSASLRVPCVARQAGRLRNSRYALRQSSPTSPGSAVLLGGGKGEPQKQLQNPVRAKPGQTKRLATRIARDSAFSKPLLRRFGLADKAGALGEHCSSSAAACVLCKLLGRVAQPPLYQPIRRNPEGAARQGALLFGYFRLGKQEKVTSCRAAPDIQSHCAKRGQNPTKAYAH